MAESRWIVQIIETWLAKLDQATLRYIARRALIVAGDGHQHDVVLYRDQLWRVQSMRQTISATTIQNELVLRSLPESVSAKYVGQNVRLLAMDDELRPDADVREAREEHAEQPQHEDNGYDGVQDLLRSTVHRDEHVDDPEDEPEHEHGDE